ncbi:MAG TPA: sensor domain-containing protein [Streptosporangiaceae bacterium]|jgi:signal transduction histidine kinase
MATAETIRQPGRFGLLTASLPLAIAGLVGGVAWAFSVIGTLASALWIGVPLLVVFTGFVRGLANLHRWWAGRVLGERIARPYKPARTGMWPRAWRILSDSATWRDVSWLLANCTLGVLLVLANLLLFLSVLFYLVAIPIIWQTPAAHLFVQNFSLFTVGPRENAWITGVEAMICLLLWLWLSKPLMRAHARLARGLLAPGKKARLAQRVQQLTEQRTETVDSHAAEVRRIERDLHDGAQARLVALGMNLGLAEEMLASDPEAARKLLAEARESTGSALSELRDLVRGIHPPVLADRGIDGAIRALALAGALPVDVDIDLPGRPTAPVESAVYFAVAEALTNAAKHSHATRAAVTVAYDDGRLRVSVRDDGRGGAHIGQGGGLHGVARRLAAFDGTLDLDSPVGGPTEVLMEVPCALSSARTSPSSGTD